MSCPECFSGHKHEGEPLGREEKVHGLDCYVTEPPEGTESKGIIVFIPDAFGWKFNNNRILADHYATKGPFRVYLPEFMDGHALSESMLPVLPNVMKTDGILTWLVKPYYIALMLYGGLPFFYYNRPALSFPHVKTFMTKLRESTDPKEKDMPVGAAGFCWGGKHITLLAQEDSVTSTGKPLVDAVFTGHPSMLSLPTDIDPVDKPYSIAIGDVDPVLPMREVEKLKNMLAMKTIPYEVEVYPGSGHGFCVRCDPGNEKLLEHSLMAEDQAVKWFQKHLKSTSA